MALTSRELVPMPMDVCVAIRRAASVHITVEPCERAGAAGPAARPPRIATEVKVAADDPALPSRDQVGGRFFSEADAKRIGAETGWDFVERDSGAAGGGCHRR